MGSPSVAVGETSLAKLLSTLQLSMHPSTFVFLTFPPFASLPPSLFQQMLFREAEGLSVISTLESAQEHHLDYTFPCRMITCDIHSSLQAVGFIAKMTKCLTDQNVGANPVSGFYHDHLFVPVGREHDAVATLGTMVEQAKTELNESN